MKKHIGYVLGFVFCMETEEVLLINKIRPKWQKGYLNGIGGKIEDDELPVKAMSRETEEEVGLKINSNDWHFVGTMSCPANSTDEDSDSWSVFIYCVNLNLESFTKAKQKEEEKPYNISLWSITAVDTSCLGFLGNISWLVGMCVDKMANNAFEPVHVVYNGLSLPINTKKIRTVSL